MNTFDLQQAADLLRIHPVTLQAKAKGGEIPGAKIGTCWVFVDVDLIIHPDQAKAKRAIAVPLSNAAVVIIREQLGRHLTHVFTYQGNFCNPSEYQGMAASITTGRD